MERAKLDGGSYNNLISKMNIIEQDLIDLKNRSNTKTNRLGDNADLTKSGDANQRLDALTEEVNNIWSFSQRFIDEHAIDMVQEVNTPDRPIRVPSTSRRPSASSPRDATPVRSTPSSPNINSHATRS